MPTSYQLKSPRLAALLLSLVVTARSQTTPAAPASTGSEDTIRLSEFNVTDKGNRGYVASETMTGTRVATQIKDLPYTVNVLTSEFFEDFAMFQLDDSLTQIGGLTGLDI